jgi:CubicO group peptidase (beta-lactamase class C family)
LRASHGLIGFLFPTSTVLRSGATAKMAVGEVSKFHPRWRRPIALSFILAFLIGSTAVATQTLDQSVDAYVRDEMTKRQIPGLALAVVRHGRIQKIASYGYADVDFSVPVKSTTLFSIASVTKTVTAVGIIKLQEEGKLSVDDSIGLYLEEVPVSWRKVKIRQVMSHTSGIPDVMSNPFTLDTVAETPEGMFHVFADKPLDFVPGSKWQYNQANFMLLGMIIEKVSGQPYTEFCRDRLFGPIGVTPTFGYPQTLVANRSHTYTILHWSPTGVSRLEHVQLQTGRLLPSMLWPAGGLNLTAAEFSKWLIALESGKVVREASLEQLWAPIKLNDGSIFEQAPPEPWRTFGLGWGSASDLGHRRVGFSGGTFATFFMYPKEELDVVVLTNMEGADPESLAEAIAHRYIAAGRSGLNP